MVALAYCLRPRAPRLSYDQRHPHAQLRGKMHRHRHKHKFKSKYKLSKHIHKHKHIHKLKRKHNKHIHTHKQQLAMCLRCMRPLGTCRRCR